jgi:hypothetical protein
VITLHLCAGVTTEQHFEHTPDRHIGAPDFGCAQIETQHQ